MAGPIEAETLVQDPGNDAAAKLPRQPLARRPVARCAAALQRVEVMPEAFFTVRSLHSSPSSSRACRRTNPAPWRGFVTRPSTDRSGPSLLALPHAGGAFPWVAGRLNQGFLTRQDLKHIQQPPIEYLRRFYYDTVGYNDDVLAYLVNVIGERLTDGPRAEVIVNRFEQRLFGPGLRRADIEQALGDSLGCTIPNNFRLVSEAIDRGVPLDEVKAGNNISAALSKLIVPPKKAAAAAPTAERKLALAR